MTDPNEEVVEAAKRILEGFREAREDGAEAAWYGFIDSEDVERVAKAVAHENVLTCAVCGDPATPERPFALSFEYPWQEDPKYNVVLAIMHEECVPKGLRKKGNG